MNRSELTDQQIELMNLCRANNLECNWWKGERLYINLGRKDAKVFLAFDEPAECAGASLKIFIDECGQPGAWYVAQKKKIAQRVYEACILAMQVCSGPEYAAKYRKEVEAAIEDGTFMQATPRH